MYLSFGGHISDRTECRVGCFVDLQYDTHPVTVWTRSEQLDAGGLGRCRSTPAKIYRVFGFN